MEIVLFLLYVIALLLQIFLLVRAVKSPVSGSWTDLYATEIISALAALLLFLYYETLSGYGPMPGLTYFAEGFLSLAAAAVYAGMLAVSAMLGMTLGARQK